jgi:hypothetical protein
MLALQRPVARAIIGHCPVPFRLPGHLAQAPIPVHRRGVAVDAGLSEKERYYQCMVNFKWEYQSTVGNWLPGLQKSLPDELPERLRRQPLAIFDEPGADITLAQRCLEVHVTRVHADPRISKDRVRQQLKESDAGRKALTWYIRSDLHNRLGVDQYHNLFRLFTHCLVAQGLVEVVWTWLSIDQAQVQHQAAHQRVQGRWKAVLLASLVEAEVFWQKGADYKDALGLVHPRFGSRQAPARCP